MLMSRDSSFIYLLGRPRFSITTTGGSSSGRCISTSGYRIESLMRLSRETLNALFDARLLGIGQEFRVISQCDGNEALAFYVESPCVEVDRRTGERITPEGRAPSIRIRGSRTSRTRKASTSTRRQPSAIPAISPSVSTR